jgi:hypothetical protein
VVKLLQIESATLHIENVDVIDGTPLLDLKPYVPDFDRQSEVRVGWLEGAKEAVYRLKSDARFTNQGGGNGRLTNSKGESMSQPDIRWTGESGRNYGYWIHPIEARFRKTAGNFIFAGKTGAGEWVPLYIGQTRNYDEGLADPEKEACARSNGATHVHTHFSSPDENVREAEVTDLIAAWKPVCNA